MHALIVSTTFTCLAGVVVAIRLLTRLVITKTPGYDDLLIVLALISSFIFFALVLIERHYGLGISKEYLSHETIQKQMLYLWLSVPFYNLALILAKLSVLVLYTRIFNNRKFLIMAYCLMGFLAVAGLWMVLSGFVFCVPIHAFWSLDREYFGQHCLRMGPVWFTNAGIHIATDIIILLFPIPLFAKLQLPRRQKVGIMLVFGLGIVVIGTSSARLYELEVMVNGHDITRTNSYTAIWSSLEANVSIICACLPPMQPLFSRIFSFFFRPRPLYASPGSKRRSTTTFLTETRKGSTFEHGISAEHGPFFNESLFDGPGGYSASISKVSTNEDGHEDEEGIRVVRELRMVSDPRLSSLPISPARTRDWDIEMNEGAVGGAGKNDVDSRIEWDLGNFEFPDYKERMNCPL
ncbi:hypothetical protein N7492_006523 [Penicillium capsulatum]|uniref:Rhodopsin domain-containing protein n=1 Tax=Penicillium capsulatum TaxID=69766 RepID=A0A9W9LL80_9EURO|nr:hypothetical protein N7492_006523 [Penicillium capsulatum]KAJ6116359.1 hypothetical protein N7512_006084 [Penicillium capsulatum]